MIRAQGWYWITMSDEITPRWVPAEWAKSFGGQWGWFDSLGMPVDPMYTAKIGPKIEEPKVKP